ncbi:MAG: dihydrolipoyllysine-residue succinyltransferase [Planctomycetota bacterium]|jgi:2-oxoglutarate dehydrogenase E2 component (dihydrolipoamide succinyltransferase)
MKHEIKVPEVGESITSGVIVSWLKQTGDQVQEGDLLFELETDKAVLEIPSTGAGTLEILVEEGTEVSIGQTVALLGPAAGEVEQQTISTEPVEAAAPRETEQAPSSEPAEVEQAEPEPSVATSAVTPSEEKVTGARRIERVPMSAIRRRTAHRLVKATQSAAYLTTFNEIDMQKVVEIRRQYRAQFEKEHGIKIGFMSFFVKACCQALKEFSSVNTQVDGDDIVYNHYYDIGVAVSIEEGLVVPNIRNADKLHFAEIEAMIASLAKRARDRKLLPDELTGGTFTITNGGVFGSLLSTPIPAHPQTAILGMHAMKKRPVVVEDQIVIRPMMYVALTYDHRVIDGREAVGFLARIKDFIEEPDKLLLEL